MCRSGWCGIVSAAHGDRGRRSEALRPLKDSTPRLPRWRGSRARAARNMAISSPMDDEFDAGRRTMVVRAGWMIVSGKT